MSYIFLAITKDSSLEDLLDAYALANLIPKKRLKIFDYKAGYRSKSAPSNMALDELLGFVSYYHFDKPTAIIKLPSEIESDSTIIKLFKNNYLGSCSGKTKKADLAQYAEIYKNHSLLKSSFSNLLLTPLGLVSDRFKACNFDTKDLQRIEVERVKLMEPLFAFIESKLNAYKDQINNFSVIFKRDY